MFAAAVINDLCDVYDIGRPLLMNSFLTEETGQRYTLVTTEGRYTVLCMTPERSLRAVGCEHHFIHYLRCHGFPALPPLLTHYGTSMALVAGQLYVVLPYIQGAPYDARKPQHLRAAAESLGTFHKLAHGFVFTLPASSDDCLDQISDEGAATLATLEAIIDGNPLLRRHKAIRQILASLHKTMDTLEADLHDVDAQLLTQTVIHGSYNRDALLFQDNVLTAVYNYTYARYAPRLIDLANALAVFGCNDESVIELAALEAFLEFYCAQWDLNDYERSLLPLALRCSWLNIGLQRCARASLVTTVDGIAYLLRGLLNELTYLEAHVNGFFGPLLVRTRNDIALAA